MRVSFVVYERAAPQGSKVAIRPGIMIESSKRVMPFRAAVKAAAMNAHIPEGWNMEAPVRLGVRFHFKRPKSHYRANGSLKDSAPFEATSHGLGDLDKLTRAVGDALTGTIYKDDRQITDLYASKCYDDQDLVTISIESLE